MNRIYLVLSFLLILLSACSSTEAPTTTQLPFIEIGIDPNSWVNIPAGEFYYGQHLHETEVDYDYKIMVTDVTNQQFADYLNEAIADGSLTLQGKKILGFYPGDAFHGYEHEEEIPPGDYVHIHLDEPGLRLNYDGNAFSTVGRYENHPMVLVTWFGAKAFCDFFGYRLPSEIEWEKAQEMLPQEKEIPSLIQQISNSGTKAGVSFLLFKPSGPVQRQNYSEIPVQIKVQCGYHQLGRFLSNIGNLARIVNVPSVRISVGQKKSIEADLSAITYTVARGKEVQRAVPPRQ